MRKPKTLFLTINTDASYNEHTKIAGLAYWVVTADAKFRDRVIRKFYSGARNSVSDVNEAELYAILEAVVLVNRDGLAQPADVIIFNTDSLTAINYINGGPEFKRLNERLAKLARRIRDIIKSWGVEKDVQFRHVAAHTDKDDKRSYVNRWCDRESRRQRRLEEARQKKSRDAENFAKTVAAV